MKRSTRPEMTGFSLFAVPSPASGRGRHGWACLCLAALAILAGCSSGAGNSGGDVQALPVPAAIGPSAAVIVGMESVNPAAYQGWAGQLPGVPYDVQRVGAACAQYGIPVKALMNADATWAGFRAAALAQSKGLPRDALLLLDYSGHGGWIHDDNGDEPSGKDSTICLWDGQVRDDRVFGLLQEIARQSPGLRVAIISDSCHSEGNWRTGPMGALARGVSFGAWGVPEIPDVIDETEIRAERAPIDMQIIQIAGCREDSVSYDVPRVGGALTSTLFAQLASRPAWRQWFDLTAPKMPANQPIVWQEFQVAPGFRDAPALR